MHDINQIATRAAAFGKPVAKQKALATLRHCIESGTVSEFDAVTLYSALLANAKRPARAAEKDNVAWVAQAVGGKDSYLNFIRADGARIFATDGHRLHLAPHTKPAGAYHPRTLERIADDDAGKAPDVDRVIPAKNLKKWSADMWQLPVVVTGRHGSELYKLPCGRHLNKQYLDQAMAGNGPAFEYQGEPDVCSSIRLDLPGGRLAVIMPVRYV